MTCPALHKRCTLCVANIEHALHGPCFISTDRVNVHADLVNVRTQLVFSRGWMSTLVDLPYHFHYFKISPWPSTVTTNGKTLSHLLWTQEPIPRAFCKTWHHAFDLSRPRQSENSAVGASVTVTGGNDAPTFDLIAPRVCFLGFQD